MAMGLMRLLTMRGLAPHGYCLLWDPALLWLHVISDALVGLSYFSIPIALLVFLARRRDVEFGWMIGLFVIFIMACGMTHFMSIVVLWVPAYGIEGLIKAVTAVASVLTAIAIWPLLPRLLAVPSPRQLQLVNEQLRKEAVERRNIEAKLRQAQKLEAIGRLTGGIAHDFNNIFTVVMGSLERAMARIDDRERALAALHNAFEASKRAEALTGQLLSFAREQKMTIEPHDLNQILREFLNLIASSVSAQVNLDVRIGDQPLYLDVDRTQLEVALLNLAINARDAMPDGGVLTIESLEPDPAEIAVRVSDTGIGMDGPTLERATDPFFTTKPVGQGTGLGLSQVYGFVRQAGGSLVLDSEPGKGTAVTITLPRHHAAPIA
jgi:signal transduction histidine kinase